MNYVASAKPLNNQTPGDISAKYPNYFTPTGFTFSIWAIIYIMLFAFVIQFALRNPAYFDQSFVLLFVLLFVVSCISNIAWLYFWHFDRLNLSLLMMFLLLGSLIAIMLVIPSGEVLMKSGFSLYTGWISVATIANVTIVLSKNKVPFFYNYSTLWFLIMITIGAILCGVVVLTSGDVLFGDVFIWAYFGILVKHLNKEPQFITDKKVLGYHSFLWVVIIAITIITFIQNGYSIY